MKKQRAVDILREVPEKQKPKFSETTTRVQSKKLCSQSSKIQTITVREFNRIICTQINFLSTIEVKGSPKRKYSLPHKKDYVECLLTESNYGQLMKKINEQETLLKDNAQEIKEQQEQIRIALEKLAARKKQADFHRFEYERITMSNRELQRQSDRRIQEFKDGLQMRENAFLLIQQAKERLEEENNKIMNYDNSLKEIIINQEIKNKLYTQKERELQAYDQKLTLAINEIDNSISNSNNKIINLQKDLIELQKTHSSQTKFRLDKMRELQILKPYYKTFLILRQGNNQPTSYKIDKTRRKLFIDKSLYSYDYIISKVTNPYEEKISNEDAYINQEFHNAIHAYIAKLSLSTEHNCFVLYITKINQTNLNETILNMFNRIISQYPTWTLTIKVIVEGNTYDIDKEIDLKYQLEIKNESQLIFMYEMRDQKNQRRLWLWHTSYDNQEINSLLSILNDLNKKKKKTKAKTECLSNEVIDLSPFYGLVLIDVHSTDIDHSEVKQLMNVL